MAPNVVVVGTLDTKGPEVAYIRDRLIEQGCATTVIDVGILGEPLGIVPDIDHGQVAAYAGTTMEEVRQAGTRGRGRHDAQCRPVIDDGAARSRDGGRRNRAGRRGGRCRWAQLL